MHQGTETGAGDVNKVLIVKDDDGGQEFRKITPADIDGDINNATNIKGGSDYKIPFNSCPDTTSFSQNFKFDSRDNELV